MRQYFIFLVISFYSFFSFSQDNNPLIKKDATTQTKWVDSLYNVMTLEEKIGQLFMVQVFSNQDIKSKNKIVKLIKDQHIGGLIYSNGGI